MRRFTRVLCITSMVVGVVGCTRRLPPAAIPAAIMPVVSVQGPPAQGHGRLIVDVAEGPVAVYRARFDARRQDHGSRRPTFRFFELEPELVCNETPCVIDRPPGNVLIGFPVLGCRAAIDYDLVHVGLQPSVYRRSLGVFENETGTEKIVGIVAASLGAAATITGIALVPAGASKDNHQLLAAGGITLGAGALVLTAGILMIRHDSATYRPGSAHHFDATLTTGGASVSASVGAAPPRSPLEVYPYYDCSWGSRRGGTG